MSYSAILFIIKTVDNVFKSHLENTHTHMLSTTDNGDTIYRLNQFFKTIVRLRSPSPTAWSLMSKLRGQLVNRIPEVTFGFMPLFITFGLSLSITTFKKKKSSTFSHNFIWNIGTRLTFYLCFLGKGQNVSYSISLLFPSHFHLIQWICHFTTPSHFAAYYLTIFFGILVPTVNKCSQVPHQTFHAQLFSACQSLNCEEY